jgi:ABC-type methionine transport system ATPase subunit
MAILQGLNRRRGMTVVLVTHDPAIARHTERILNLHDGQITHNEIVDEPLLAMPEGTETRQARQSTQPSGRSSDAPGARVPVLTHQGMEGGKAS